MLVFTVIFDRLANLPSDGTTPYPILVFVAMLPWQLFATGVSDSSNSLITNSNMLSKVYFPRLIIPTSAVIVSLVDFFISFFLLCLLMGIYGFVPSWRICLLPFFLGLTVLTALGFGFFLSALNVKYRDFRYIVPFMVQFGLYISPVGFSSGIVPDEWRLFYSMNPMVGVIDGFRWAILGGDSPLYLPGFALSVVLALLVFSIGLYSFRKMECSFADHI
jgi:homopolymeric O-antigen transport system permease protein